MLHLQRSGGTKQMWEILSFQGRFDPEFFKNLPEKPKPEDLTSEQREKTKQAIEARKQLRMAKKIGRQHAREPDRPLRHGDQRLLRDLEKGKLRENVNKLTRESGNGRLRRRDGSFVDIGGSTGGMTRTVLYGYVPPNLHEFDHSK